MAYKTKAQVVAKIERDLDLEEEEFIQDNEMNEYINDAITVVEAHLTTMGLKDRYFYTRTTLSLVQGTADYALPENLYEDKIKEVVYSNGATIYRVGLLDSEFSEEEIEHLNRFSTTEYYQYRIRNDSSDGKYFQLIPSSRETAADVIKIGYFRDLERVEEDDDLVEVPDIALQWLYQYIRVRVYEKESHANYASAKEDMMGLEELMLSTLRGQLADSQNTKLEMDKTIYEEMS
jgi:hypothetical protein